jgi:phage terminase large subunit-like protein
VHKSRDLIDVIETATGSRRQPLILFITTADDDDQTSIYDEKRIYVERLAEGIIEDPSTYGVVFAAPDDADPFAEATWEQANPGLDRSVKRPYLRAQAKRAKASPAYLPTYKRLHLGIRSRPTSTQWLPLNLWDACEPLPPTEELAGMVAYGGLDLASSADFAAWQVVVPLDEDDSIAVLSRFFLPEAAVDRRGQMQSTLRVWAASGLIDLTPGRTISFDRIKAVILKDAAALDLRSIGYDRWNAVKLVQELEDEGIEMVPVAQTLSSLSVASKHLERLVDQGKLRHGYNPVLRWMADNTVPLIDADENVKPDKKRSRDKIDGIVATVDALKVMLEDRSTEIFALNLGALS